MMLVDRKDKALFLVPIALCGLGTSGPGRLVPRDELARHRPNDWLEVVSLREQSRPFPGRAFRWR